MEAPRIFNKLKIISPFYNPGDFLDMCINSLLTQDYENYEVLFIDDASTDNSYSKIPACTYKVNEKGEPEKDENGELIILEKHPLLEKTKCLSVQAWRANIRATALPNLHAAIMNWCTDPDDIVVIVDGDDYLKGKNVLAYINDYYNNNPDCWFMYGSSIWTDGRKCCSSAYSEEEFKNLRRAPFRVSHIRTFRAGLYHKIAEQDPQFTCLNDKNGEMYKSCYDVALCYPMLEMAGFKHIKHNKEKLYVYNRENPISDDRVDQALQTNIHFEILTKKPFKPIQNYK